MVRFDGQCKAYIMATDCEAQYTWNYSWKKKSWRTVLQYGQIVSYGNPRERALVKIQKALPMMYGAH